MTDRTLNITWGGTAPWLPYGYGVTTELVVPRLRDRLGHEMSISAYYGLPGGKLTWRGIPVYPSGFAAFGNDIHAANAKQAGAELLITHQDVWPQSPDQLTAHGMRWVAWAPIDSESIAPQIALRMKECYQAIALSHFGQKQAALAGLDLPLIVQGVDTTIFTPGSKTEARERLGWPKDAFIVGMVAMNTGYPSRKAYPQQLEAFGRFFEHHSDAMLYLHCYGEPEMDENAIPLVWHLERYGAQNAALWADPYQLAVGYTQAQMVDRYRAFDVLLCVSMSEGFGIPLIEAQSCGCPVVVGDWTAMSENCYAGWKVAREDSEPWPVSPLRCFWRLPHIGAITEQLEAAYTALQSNNTCDYLAGKGRHYAVANHDQDMLIDTQWRAVLQGIAQRIADEPTPWHRHQWAAYGHQDGRGVIVPCTVADCPAERAGEAVAPLGFPLVIDGITLDIADDPNGGVKHDIAHEITSVYRLQDMTFQPGDVVIDVGAHVGIVSCYLAKKWPEITVYAIEPIPANHDRLLRNIKANDCTGVQALHAAITDDRRDLTLSGDPQTNSGHYSAFAEAGPDTALVASMRLTDVIHTYGIDGIALLKLDCEGAEYEILYGTDANLWLVDTLIMEIHENGVLRADYTSGAQLAEYVKRFIPTVRASVITIPDTEEEVTYGIIIDGNNR